MVFYPATAELPSHRWVIQILDSWCRTKIYLNLNELRYLQYWKKQKGFLAKYMNWQKASHEKTRGKCLDLPPQPSSAAFKTLMTFHYTGWLIGILTMAYYDPYITGILLSIKQPTKVNWTLLSWQRKVQVAVPSPQGHVDFMSSWWLLLRGETGWNSRWRNHQLRSFTQNLQYSLLKHRYPPVN